MCDEINANIMETYMFKELVQLLWLITVIGFIIRLRLYTIAIYLYLFGSTDIIAEINRCLFMMKI
jgi:hypothetical protein